MHCEKGPNVKIKLPKRKYCMETTIMQEQEYRSRGYIRSCICRIFQKVPVSKYKANELLGKKNISKKLLEQQNQGH